MAERGRDPAEARLWWLTLVRLAGIGGVLLGLMVAGRSDGEALRVAAGLALMAGGGAVSLLGPKWLARRWKE
jgi:hypothetical protein